MPKNLQIATVGGGCFWCTEAVFQEVRGVEKVISGYAGGDVPGRPTYREICSGLTGAAEVVQITFDATLLSYEALLVIFMTTHDPHYAKQTRCRQRHSVPICNFSPQFRTTKNCTRSRIAIAALF